MNEVNTQIPVLFQKLQSYESADDTRFLKVKIWLMHLGENLNGSYFDKSVVEDAIPTLANTPILAYIEDNSDGEKDFSDHRQVLVKEDGKYKIKYIGQAIGTIGETNNAQFEMRLCDDGVEREFLTVEGLVWQKWDDPIDIFNRDIIKNQSMELHSDYTGEWKEDKLFHFTSFKFFGACALGKNVLPAMVNSTIEAQFNYDNMFAEINNKVEQFKTLYSTNKSVQEVVINVPETKWKCPHCTNLIGEKELYYDGKNWFHRPCIDHGEIVLPESKHTLEFNNISNKEGGCKLDISTLLAKYSISLEDLNAKNINHEEFTSIEELEVKIQEVFQSNKGNTDFALTYTQLKDELRAELYKEKQKDSWGYEYTKYWFVDFDDQKVIAEDGEDSYRLVSFDYSVNGDKVAINFESKQRVKIAYLPFEGDAEVTFEVVSKERQDYQLKVKEKELSTQFEQDKETAINQVKEQYSALENEVSELRTFKQNKLAAERKESEDALFEQFSGQLTEDEMKEIKEKVTEYSLEEIETKLFALVGKKNAKFTAQTKKKDTVKIEIDTHTEPDVSGKPYAHLIQNYTKK